MDSKDQPKRNRKISIENNPDAYLRYAEVFSELNEPIDLDVRENVYFFNSEKQKVPEEYLKKSAFSQAKIVQGETRNLF